MSCENPYSLNFESDCGELLNQSSWNSSKFGEIWGSESMPDKQSLVLDGEKGELVKASGRIGKKIGVSETKTMAALKSHSEAERRRRERINAHLATLRGLVPNDEKVSKCSRLLLTRSKFLLLHLQFDVTAEDYGWMMDKAALLAEVISQVEQLKTTATQASKGFHIPMDADEVEVEILDNNVDAGSFLLRASLCCDYRPDLLSDIRQAISNLPVQVLKCEISTLGERVKSVFLITTGEGNSSSAAPWELIVSSVRTALSGILDKVSESAEYEQQIFFPRKRQRVSYFNSSCSSSS